MTLTMHSGVQWRPDVLWSCPHELIVKENCQPNMAAGLGVFNEQGRVYHILRV